MSFNQATVLASEHAADGTGHASPAAAARRETLVAPYADVVPSTGQARIMGDDPLQLTVVNLGLWASDPRPYGGRYPGGSLVHDGVWYYGTYALDDFSGACGNWCTLGPFVGFRHSTDYGGHWTETRHTPARPLFGETTKEGMPVKLGALHVVDFGQNMEHSPDGKAYLIGHGASRRGAHASWIAGDEIYLVRVTPSIATIDDPAAYEFFAGHDDAGRAIWAADLAAIQPLLAWQGHLGCVTITFNAPLRRYFMCISRPIDGVSALGRYDTMILEAAEIGGPWRLVHYLPEFGPQAYFVNIPTKFIGGDGHTAWLCYSANFASTHNLAPHEESRPEGSQYRMCLREFILADV
jgi:hypothetical protein